MKKAAAVFMILIAISLVLSFNHVKAQSVQQFGNLAYNKDWNLEGGVLIASQFNIQQSMTVTWMSVMTQDQSPPSFIRLGIFSDNNNQPYMCLDSTTLFPSQVNLGWYQLPLSETLTLSAGTYWLAELDSGAQVIKYTQNPGSSSTVYTTILSMGTLDIGSQLSSTLTTFAGTLTIEASYGPPSIPGVQPPPNYAKDAQCWTSDSSSNPFSTQTNFETGQPVYIYWTPNNHSDGVVDISVNYPVGTSVGHACLCSWVDLTPGSSPVSFVPTYAGAWQIMCNGYSTNIATPQINAYNGPYLTVSSGYGSPSPASGWYNAGSSITASVNSPVAGPPGIQYVCTGWSGTGSVPVSGSSSSVTFTINTPSSITWNWKTQYYLTISSEYGSPSPASGWYNAGTQITASVPSPVSGSSSIRYVCNGWSGTGSIPASGTASSVTFTINAPSNITWNWKTQYLLTENIYYGTTAWSGTSSWADQGSVVQIKATSGSLPLWQAYWNGWVGQGNGQYTGMNNPVYVTMNGPINETGLWNAYSSSTLCCGNNYGCYNSVTVSGITVDPSIQQVTFMWFDPNWNTFAIDTFKTSTVNGPITTFTDTQAPTTSGNWLVYICFQGQDSSTKYTCSTYIGVN